jgi:hypothetical protein
LSGEFGLFVKDWWSKESIEGGQELRQVFVAVDAVEAAFGIH